MTPEAGHKENEDEFVSRVWRFKQNIFQYLWTIYYAWAKPKYLVSKPNPVPVEFDRPEKRPLPPVFFLATGYLLLAVTEKVIFTDSGGSFELPPQFVVLKRLVDFLPGGVTLLMVGATVGWALVPYFILRMSKTPVPFKIMSRTVCYQQGVLLPLAMALFYLPLAVLPSLTYGPWIKYPGWVFAPISLYSVYWLAKQLKNEGYAGTVAVWLGSLILAVVMVTSNEYEVWPTKSYNIPSGAMIPTLIPGDVVVVNTWVYYWRKPQYGEIVVFHLPRDPATPYVDRLVGLPGDSIQLVHGVLNVNGQPVSRQRISDFVYKPPYEDGGSRQLKRFRETLPNGVSYDTIDLVDEGFADKTEPYVVPPDHYFLWETTGITQLTADFWTKSDTSH